METIMLDKAIELFSQCDAENKGFITKRDMQRLNREMLIDPEQLEIVFDSLDEDQNGYLTLQEFTDGFGSFLGVDINPEDYSKVNQVTNKHYENRSVVSSDDVFKQQDDDDVDYDKLFIDMLLHIDAERVFKNEDVVKAMWIKTHKLESELVLVFEDFLCKTAQELKNIKGESLTLENILKIKSSEHEDEVKKLYEEMEFQMKQEQMRIYKEEKQREFQIKEEMDGILEEKEQQLQEMHSRHNELEENLTQLHLQEASIKQDNQRLLQEKEELQEILLESQESFKESRSYIQMLQSHQMDEKKARARAALQLSEGIALERESLVKQLGILKDVNKKLLDDRDEAETFEARRDSDQHRPEPSQAERQSKFGKQGSILSKYFPGGGSCNESQTSEALAEIPDSLVDNLPNIETLDDIETDDVTDAHLRTFYGTSHSADKLHDIAVAPRKNECIAPVVNGNGNSTAAGRPTLQDQGTEGRQTEDDIYGGSTDGVGGFYHAFTLMNNSLSVTCKDVNFSSATQGEFPQHAKVQRLFKVVFVGDSGVGKSCFIRRFCLNTFKSSFCTTIGVDFQVKELLVDDHCIVLQLWDTAGQERYRSLNKQYFRKADGIVVMYNIDSEKSFLNVRHWLDSIGEGIDKDTVLMVIGNKSDLAELQGYAKTIPNGSKMAVEYDALFYETSAMSGSYIVESMLGLASSMIDKEDRSLEASITLTNSTRASKSCCR